MYLRERMRDRKLERGRVRGRSRPPLSGEPNSGLNPRTLRSGT